jgi:hypothetical protein
MHGNSIIPNIASYYALDMQTAKLRQFVRNSRKKSAANDARTSWVLEFRSLASQAAACEQELEDMLTALHTSKHIPSDFFDECQNASAMYGQLYTEEAGLAKSTASTLHGTASRLRACTAESFEVGQLLSDLARESELQWHHVVLLENDASLLIQEVRWVHLPVVFCEWSFFSVRHLTTGGCMQCG